MAITRVSTAADGSQADGASFGPSLSADGTKILFQSTAGNLDAAAGFGGIFVKDLATGAITRVDAAANGTPATLVGDSGSLSGDGSTAVFQSIAPNLVPGDGVGEGVGTDPFLTYDLFAKDLDTGGITRVGPPRPLHGGGRLHLRCALPLRGRDEGRFHEQ